MGGCTATTHFFRRTYLRWSYLTETTIELVRMGEWSDPDFQHSFQSQMPSAFHYSKAVGTSFCQIPSVKHFSNTVGKCFYLQPSSITKSKTILHVSTFSKYATIKTSACLTTGWWDRVSHSSLRSHLYSRERRTRSGRINQRLIETLLPRARILDRIIDMVKYTQILAIRVWIIQHTIKLSPNALLPIITPINLLRPEQVKTAVLHLS